MVKSKSHKDVEFAVDDFNGRQRTFKTFDEAAGFALSVAASKGKSTLDVLVYSKAGARFFAGDEAVDVYNEDPDASVHERLEIKVNSLGRVS